MSDSRGKKLVFVGQLFRGDPKNKSWTPVITGQVGVSIQQTSDGWSLVAAKKETVWEMVIGSGFKHRVRDNFVQWQRKCVGGTVETFGLRVKGDADAQQMSEALTKWLSKLEERKKETVVAPPLPSMQPDDVVLKVFIPGRDPTNVCVPQSATVQQVMKSVCQRRELDPTQFLVTLPPNSPGGQPVVCKGHMIIGELSTNEIHLSKRRKSPKRESPTHSENSTKEHLLLLQVELPKGEHTVVRVSPTISMTALLSYICEKRNLPVEVHCFDLPATEESLANKTLQELKINSIRVISTATDSGSDQSANSSPSHAKKVKGHTLSLSSLSQDSSQSRRRNAPPPPPPSNQRRRTQPSFMRELTAEVVTRQSHDIKATPISILTTPTGSTEHVDTLGAEPKRETLNREPKRRMTTGSSRRSLKPRNAPAPPPPTQTTPPPVAKGRPPPVAEKPHKTKTHQESIDEPDFSGPIDEPVLKGSEVIGIKGSEVVGVKGRVREQKERPDLTDSITEGLKKQTATAERRHTGVSRKRMELKETHHMSLDSDAHTPPPLTHTPPLTHPIMVPIEIPDTEDDQLFSDRGKTLPKRRSPAPRPPPSHKSHTLGRTARQTSADINGLSQSRDNLEEIKDDNKEKKKTPRSPRKRPSRPAPVPPPASKAIQDQEVQGKILDFKKTPSPPPQPSQESPSPPPQPSHAPSSPPPQPSHAPSSPPQPSQESSSPQHKQSPGTTQKATAICRDTEDGGKVLIVQPSPSIDRRAKVQAPIIFKLPPPPPQPNRGGNKEKKSVSKDLENKTVPSKEDVEKQNFKLEEIKEVEKIKVEEIKEEEIKKVEEVERPNNDTILSNEYTNLDDSDASEEMTLDFTNERNGDQQNGMDSDSTGTSSDSERGYDITVDDQSDSPNKKSVTNGSYNILEDNLNLSINSNSNNSNDSADELGAPPPPPNRNYGDDSADELGAPPPPPNCNYGDDSTDELEVPPPPPPAEFEENTSNSSLDSITELPDLATEQQTTPTKGAGILLLSYKPSAQTKESPTLTEAYKGDSDTTLDAASVEGVRNVECVGAGWTEEPVSPGLSSQLMELDSVVSDLRDLLNVEDYTTSPEAAIVAVVTSTVVPPPPPHVGTPTQSLELPLPVHVEDVVPPPLEGPSTHSQEIPPPLEESLLPPPTLSQDAPILPPPPSTLSQDAPILPPPPSTLSQDAPILPPPPSTPSQDALIVPPPPSTLSQDTQSPQNQLKRNPIPTKPKPPVVSSRLSNVIKASTVTTTRTQATKSTNELLEKFRERQAKLKAQKSAEALTTLTSSTPAPIPTTNVSIPNNPSAPLGGATGNDAVQAQLAFLQQQVLQQQMLQLQQQFQQLQSLAMQPGSGMGGAGMGMPGMVPGSYLPPGPHNPMMFPGAAPMMIGQSAYQMPPGYMTQQPGMPLYAAQQPTGYNTPPHPAMFPSSQLPPASHTPLLASHPPRDSPPPPLPSQPPPDLPLHTSSPLVLRKVSQETRSMALGGIEDKFDSLMGEVRESDPTVVLKRVSASSHEGRDSPEPTGMAAALEVALRQRRQHFSDHDKRRSIDDSYSSEWQSP